MPVIDITASPNLAAADKFRARTPIATRLDTEGMSDLAVGLRERAFWSAGLDKIRNAQQMNDSIQRALDMVRRGDGTFQTRERFVAEMREQLQRAGFDPRGLGKSADYGTIRDLTSVPRLRLIFDTNMGMARGFAKWQSDQDPASLEARPAQEFIRVSTRKVPRTNWPQRWHDAGGKFFGAGRMIALKNDPVWTELSRFGTPWPPFDFGSGMGIRNIRRAEAEKLGLIKPGQQVKPAHAEFNKGLQASVTDLKPEYRSWLKEEFGDLIAIEHDTARWIGLRSQEQQTIYGYTEGERSIYDQMNRGLRSGNPGPAVLEQARELDAALEKLPCHAGEVYRGERLSAADLDTYESGIGKVIKKPAFTSSSASSAESYPGNAQFIITSKTGRRIAMYSAKIWQQEVLFRTGTKFRVDDIARLGDSAMIWLTEQ